MKIYEEKTDVFSIEPDVWQARVGDEILPTTWRDKGSAMAGLDVECRRRGVHELSRTCWCGPELDDGAALNV